MTDDFYRELILDHYKSPRGHGTLDPCDARAEGQNPLCGDEIAITLRLGEGDVVEARFSGRGCAISQAAASMLMEIVPGKSVAELAAMTSDEMLEVVGVPLGPARVKCAVLALGVLKVALHEARGTPLPEGWAGFDELRLP